MEKERVWVERGAIALRGALLMACEWRRIARGWPSTAMGPGATPLPAPQLRLRPPRAGRPREAPEAPTRKAKNRRLAKLPQRKS
jgi:hypothetical protein